MTIPEDLLHKLDVISMEIRMGKKSYPCFLKRQNGPIWTLLLTTTVNFNLKKVAEIKINFRTESFTFNARIKDFGQDYCQIVLPENIDNEMLANMLSTLYEAEYNDEKYGRRKETRIEIGKKGFSIFGLNSLQQSVYFNNMRILQPCAILDVSIHGVSIITRYTNSSKNADLFLLEFKFIEPEEKVLLQCHKVHQKINKTDGSCFITLSCQLLEPINYTWKERVINLIKLKS